LKHYKRLFDTNFAKFPEEEVRSSGYVVDTLEAAIWCLMNTDNYKDCVLKAVNLGDNTDTVAAVAGGLAGMTVSMLFQKTG
jgi:ADP-ribosylglycohydrolase